MGDETEFSKYTTGDPSRILLRPLLTDHISDRTINKVKQEIGYGEELTGSKDDQIFALLDGGASVHHFLRELKTTHLQAILRVTGFPTTGLKSDLVARIASARLFADYHYSHIDRTFLMDASLKDRVQRVFFGLTIADLKTLCKDYQVSGFSKLKKAELIDVLLESLQVRDDFAKIVSQLEEKAINTAFEKSLNILKGTAGEKITRFIADEEAGSVNVVYRGFKWKIRTELSIRNLTTKSDPLDFDFACRCQTGQNGGFCEHLWIPLLWFFQKYELDLSRWDASALPGEFESTLGQPIMENLRVLEPELEWNYEDVESCILEEFRAREKYTIDQIKTKEVYEIRAFMREKGIPDPDPANNRPNKTVLFDTILESCSEADFTREYFEFLVRQEIQAAKQCKVVLENLEWDPLSCRAVIQNSEPNGPPEYTITIKDAKIGHEECHWKYHQDRWCIHIMALFLKLQEEDQEAIIRYLGHLKAPDATIKRVSRGDTFEPGSTRDETSDNLEELPATPSLSSINDRLERVSRIIQVSNKIKLEMMRQALDMETSQFSKSIFDWAHRFGFTIDGDYIIINKESTDDFMRELEEEFKSWGSAGKK